MWFGRNGMNVSLDTNVWLFGIVGVDVFCERILLNLQQFDVVVPDQVRAELERNLSDFDMKQFYQFLLRSGVTVLVREWIEERLDWPEAA